MWKGYVAKETRESWRFMEQFSLIATKQPVWAGDLISKADTKRLRLADLVKSLPSGNGYVLTWRGKLLWHFWKRVGQ